MIPLIASFNPCSVAAAHAVPSLVTSMHRSSDRGILSLPVGTNTSAVLPTLNVFFKGPAADTTQGTILSDKKISLKQSVPLTDQDTVLGADARRKLSGGGSRLPWCPKLVGVQTDRNTTSYGLASPEVGVRNALIN